MKIRRLYEDEGRCTISLWQDIFAEDSPKFLEYYYKQKTKDNCIYIVEENNEVCAMLHINPYDLVVGGKIKRVHYIVAVATKEEYRHKKYMSSLLKQAEDDMKKAKEPFAFLMPAAEAIYSPHGYRFIYDQEQGKICGKKPCSGYTFSIARQEDNEEMAQFSNHILKGKKEVFALRSPKYYEVLRKEQESENGGIVIVRNGKTMIGMFSYTNVEEEYEIREPLFLEGYEDSFSEAVYELTKKEEEVSCYGYGKEKKPMIMAKILDVKEMLECLKAEEEIDLLLTVTNEFEQEAVKTYHISGKETLYVEQLKENKKVQSIGIGDLTSIIFGYKNLEEVAISEELKKELLKIKPLLEVFLNEVV